MHITEIKTADLKQALKACKTLLLFQAADIPLRVDVTDDGLVLSGSGGGSLVRAFVEGNVKETGHTTLDLGHVLGLHLSGKNSSIKTLKKQVELRSGRGLYKLGILAEEAKPVKTPKPTSKTVQTDVPVLRSAIKAIWFGHDDSGSGDIRLVFGKGKLRAETADEFRGVVYSKPLPTWKTKPLCKAVLPKKSADSILSCFERDAQIWMETTETSLRLYTDETYVSIPLVSDSSLPNVATAIRDQQKSADKTTTFTLVARDLSDITKAATSVLDKSDAEKIAAAHAHLKAKDGRFTLQSSGDIGSFATQVPTGTFSGAESEICVLAKNLADLVDLAKNTGDDLKIEFWGEQFVMLRSVGTDYRSVYVFPQVRE